ncbi:hypothetical protein POVCU1_004110, partial [Plasmodium ovale curtisi]
MVAVLENASNPCPPTNVIRNFKNELCSHTMYEDLLSYSCLSCTGDLA